MVCRMVEELGEKLEGKAFVVTCMVSQYHHDHYIHHYIALLMISSCS